MAVGADMDHSTAVTTAVAVIAPAVPASASSGLASTGGEAGLKDALLSEIRKSKVVFYNTVVAQAQKIEVAGGPPQVRGVSRLT